MNRIDPKKQAELLESESVTPSFRENYQREVRAMLEKPLKIRQRVACALSMVLGLYFFIQFGYAAIAFGELPVTSRLGFALGSVFGLVWCCATIRILRRGAINIRTDPTFTTGIMWVFLVLMMVIFLHQGMEAEDAAAGARTIVYGLVFLLMGCVFMIRNFVEQSENRMREELLEIKLRLAELGAGASRRGYSDEQTEPRG